MAPVRRHAYEAVQHGNKAAVTEFNINESMVRKWRKQEDDMRQLRKTK